MSLLAAALVSPWIAIPLAAAGMILIAGYTLAIQRDDTPLWRRRIRSASGVLHIIILAALAYGSSVASPADKKLFVMTWLLIVGLVGIAVLLAAWDMIINIRQHIRDRREYARASTEALARDLAERSKSS